MKRIGRLFRRLVQLVVVTATLSAIIVVLDAVLSPGEDPRRS